MHLDPDLFLICATIVVWMVAGRWYKLRSRELELRAMTGQMHSGQTSSEISALRQEIVQLRETTTRFDMSVESSMTEMQRRLSRLEAAQNTATSAASAPASPPIALPAPEIQSIAAGRQTS